jgi:hypothetical protein
VSHVLAFPKKLSFLVALLVNPVSGTIYDTEIEFNFCGGSPMHFVFAPTNNTQDFSPYIRYDVGMKVTTAIVIHV